MKPAPKPFRLSVPEAAIADLRERLSRTRFPDEPPLEPWSSGTSLAYLKDLTGYWQSSFDWRVWAGEAEFLPAIHGSPPRHRPAFHPPPRSSPR